MATISTITIMTNNTSEMRQFNQQDDPQHHSEAQQDGAGYEGTRIEQQPQQQSQQRRFLDSSPTYAAHHPRNGVDQAVNDFLPAPEISASPSSITSTRKTWEGAYRNYLSLGGDATGKGSCPSFPSSTSPNNLVTPRSRKSSFSIIPGSKRLVSRPQPQPGHKRMGSNRSIPVVPTLPKRLSSRRLRITSEGDLQNGEKAVRGGKLFHSMFHKRGMSTDSVALNKSRSASHDELDAPLRKGVSPSYRKAIRNDNEEYKLAASPPRSIPLLSPDSDDEVDSELDVLLASGDIFLASASSVGTSPAYSMGTRILSSSSLAKIQHPVATSMDSLHGMPTHVVIDSSGVDPYNSTGHTKSNESSTSNTASHHLPGEPRRGSLGAILSHQVSNAHESDAQDHFQEQKQQESNDTIINEDTDATEPTMLNSSSLESILLDPAFSIRSTSSNSIHTHTQPINHGSTSHQAIPSPPSMQQEINPEMKKRFTQFHNASKFAGDSTSAFLGERDDCNPPSLLPHDSYNSYELMMMRSGGGSAPQHHVSYSDHNIQPPINLSMSLPLEQVDETNISVRKGMRMLKPFEATDSWQKDRRYLIAPAALAACPLKVINKLSGSLMHTVESVATNGKDTSMFGSIELGDALITYVGNGHHLNVGKWSSCRLVLRQNYLLEYDCAVPSTGLPRGFAHLQYAIAYPHADFENALKLQFYASPCAKSDMRVLMIRVENRADRDQWITCLNNAAKLRIEDLWDYDPAIEIGRGRYASVIPARRKTKKNYQKKGESLTGEGKADRQELLQGCDCALKIVDKNQFWRRVVKGKERADTLVREPSVQSTLTAKCGLIPTFLQLRGFFETSDHVVMELELLEGADLFDYVSSKGRLAEDEAARIIRDVLMSLDAMSRVGLAHRDIKPANILMCCQEEEGVSVKIGDFGMSTFVGVDGLVRGSCGTSGYVAPEILTAGGRGYGNKVDVFSAGVTLYVMLCGYEPFYGETEKELVEANKRAVFDFPESDWSKISDDARDLVKKMMAPNPYHRLSAKEALQHPWITRLDSHKTMEDFVGKNITLASSDAPEEGACTIS